jgi:hypothetical protein
MGTLGVGVMNLTIFSLSSKSNPKIDGNLVTFGTIDFQPHPPTLAPIFARLDQEMDLTIGSFNFRVGFVGSLRLSDSIPSDPSVGNTASAAASETSVGSSSEVKSPTNIKPVEGMRSIVDKLDGIMENLDLEESPNYSNMASEGNSDSISDYSKKGFHHRLWRCLLQFRR